MAEELEVVTRLGDTLLEVTRVGPTGDFTLGDHALVRAGAIASERGRVGLVDYEVRRVAATARTLPYARERDPKLLAYLAGSLVLHLMLWNVAVTRAPVAAAQIEHREPPRRHPYVHVSALHDVPEMFEPDKSPDDREPGRGAPMAGADGVAGDARSQRNRGHIEIAERVEMPQLTRNQALEQARTAGILGAEAAAIQGPIVLTGTSDLTSGFDAIDITGPLYGGDGEANGGFGTAVHGFGASSGCQGSDCSGIIGVTRWGTLSNGTTPGNGWGGRPIGAATSRSRIAVRTVDICGRPYEDRCSVFGDLHPDLVRRAIRRRRAQLEYCHEMQLLVTPALAGLVMADLSIAADGRVLGSHASGMHDDVARCVAKVLAGTEFPIAAGGTHVTYAFAFRGSARR